MTHPSNHGQFRGHFTCEECEHTLNAKILCSLPPILYGVQNSTFAMRLCACLNSSYEGDVVNGQRHGHGHFVCKNKKTTYTGEWKFGKRNGKGKMVYSIDNPLYYYEGDWVDNCKNGFGKMQYE